MSQILGQRAVVIGAGIGGLSAAGALAAFFNQVDVLERDDLPQSIASRPGTPQDRHSHGLLAGGLEALAAIYPGIDHDLEHTGAVRVRVGQDILHERADIGAMPQRDLGRSLLCATRPLIEYVVRQRTEALPNVTLHPGCRVREITTRTPQSGIPSVRFETRSGRFDTSAADLVVDASGRGLPTLGLFDACGWKRPDVTEVGIDLHYATALIKIPPEAPAAWKFAVTMPNPPTSARLGVMIPVEHDRWTVTVSDHGGTPPNTWPDFLQALRGLATPSMFNALRHAEPPDTVRTYRFHSSQWRHFQRLPRGVLPIADALCRFNPIYGQGMSSAARQARLLHDLLQQAATEADPIATVQTRFITEVTTLLQTPWSMSTAADLAFPATRGERPDNFEEIMQSDSALFRAAVVDPVVHRCLMDVAQLLLPQTALSEPDIQGRIAAASTRTAA